MILFAEKRHFIRIIVGRDQATAETRYYRSDLPFELFLKWNWYFLYREAIYRIKYPRYYIRLDTGHYEYETPKEITVRKLKDYIAAKKRVISRIEHAISHDTAIWDQLFPISEHPNYQKAVSKLHDATRNKEQLERELQVVLDSEDQQPCSLPTVLTCTYINIK